MTDDLRMVLRYARPYRGTLVLAGLLMALQSASALGLPWLCGQLAAALAGDESSLSIDLVFLAMAGLFAIQASLALGHGYLLARTGDRVSADLRVRVYNHAQALPLGFYHERSRGDVLTLLTEDVDVLGGFISGTLVTVAPSLVTFAGALAMMMWIDGRLGAFAGLAVPAFFVALQLMGRTIRPLSGELTAVYARIVARAEESLALLPIIKAFTREAETSTRYEREARHVQALSTRHALARLRLGPAVELAATLGVLALMWLATRDVQAGALDPAALVTFMMYGLLLTRPMGGLASAYGETQHARAVTARLLDVLRTAPEADGDTGRSLPRVTGAIRFEAVSFRYPGREPTFEHFSLSLSPGEIVAITGPNGAGKSTLVSLLMRFVVPDRGRILIDEVDLSTVSLASLREQIGLVPQYMLLLSGTVRENIAVGRLDASPHAIETAARAAGAHDFIVRLPAAYDTVVGEKGVKLSGGQQQRLALARALLKNPPILILDEATAMFDPEGEDEFLAFVTRRLRDRTVILITHRAAALKVADRVLRLEAGAPCAIGA